MKKSKTSTNQNRALSPRHSFAREEALERMKEFLKRKEQFLATAQANKS
jgi:hypothetical protein